VHRPALAYSLAASSIVLDGVGVAGWLAARELDDRPRARRRFRAALLAGVATVALAQAGADMALRRPGTEGADRDDPLVSREDAVAFRRYGAVALVATALVRPIEKRAPMALAGRGVSRPHLAFGAMVGTAYAVATAPVWLRQARDRLHPPPRPPAALRVGRYRPR
jgi:hypothetical protein